MSPVPYTHPPLVRGADLITCLLLLVFEREWVDVHLLEAWLIEYWRSCDEEMCPRSFARFRGMLTATHELAKHSDGRLRTQDATAYCVPAAAPTSDHSPPSNC
jgi:hypothetical protein